VEPDALGAASEQSIDFRVGDRFTAEEIEIFLAARRPIMRYRRLADIEPNFPEFTPRQPNRVYESMTRFFKEGYTVRVWRSEESLKPAPTDDIKWALALAPIDSEPADLVAIVEALPRVVAVEVLDDDGNGILLYPDWN
jgi:hypothetical protein